MHTATESIRRLTVDDFEAYKQMQTGIEDDYVLYVFPQSVRHEETYGEFIDGQLVTIAAITVLAGRYAMLGRLRTDRRFRGKGLATHLLSYLCEMIDMNPRLSWAGLTTQSDNYAVHHLAKKLGTTRLSTFYSCGLEEEGLRLLSSGVSEEWLEATDDSEKKNLLDQLVGQNHPLNIFPYACYYPLPVETEAWLDAAYLNQCRCFYNGERLVLFMKDEKGSRYLHMKYFWDDAFSRPGMWQVARRLARETGRTIWIDLAHTQRFLGKQGPMSCETWMCFGRASEKSGNTI